MLTLVLADITTLRVDAVVNAANTTLLGGGGVDGAIHRAAGPGLLRECRGLGGCLTGEAKTTAAYDLSAKYVIHTVGPVWMGGTSGEDGLLASCYDACFREARAHEVGSIAFPSISTGAYEFPVERAVGIALERIHARSTVEPFLDVTVALFDDHTLRVYQEYRTEKGI